MSVESAKGDTHIPAMADVPIRDFHAHIYFDSDELERARSLAEEARRQFGVAVGHFHRTPIGPHPRGSVQMTVDPAQFGPLARWLSVARGGLTIFAHASTGDDLRDHTHNVVWFGPSETLDLTVLR